MSAQKQNRRIKNNSKNKQPKLTAAQKRKRQNAQRILEQERIRTGKDRCGGHGGKTAMGTPCTKAAGWGTRHVGDGRCKHHGGNNGPHESALVRKAANTFSRPVKVTPGQALAGVLHLVAGQLTWTTLRIGELEEEEIINDGVVHPLVRFQRSIILDLTKIAKTAHDAGIDERLVELAEQQTKMVAKLIENVAEDLKLTKEQRKLLGPAVRRHLSLVQGREDEQEVLDAQVVDG